MSEITIMIDNHSRLHHVSDLLSSVFSQIRARLTFDNPQYLEAQKRNFSTWSIPRELRGYEIDRNTLIIPRGFTRQLLGILKEAGCSYRIDDRRRTFPDVEFQFHGTLRGYQGAAVEHTLRRDFGTLEAPTGAGKTNMALYIIAMRRQPALILVHTKELLQQWCERVETFLGIPKEEIGIIGDGKKTVGQKITVGIVNSVYPIAEEIKEYFGHLIIDEAHRCPSRTFTQAVTAFDCKYMLGLSATPWRRDGLSRFIWWYVGDKVHEVDRSSLIEDGHVLTAEVITRETGYTSFIDASVYYSRMLSELTQDKSRNSLITEDIVQEALETSGILLVLSDRKAHVDALAELIEGRGIKADRLTGSIPDSERKRIVSRLNLGEAKVLVATAQLIGEGFDCPGLSSLFLTTPIKFDGRLLQCLGRVLRPAPGKDRAKVFDYVDQIGVLRNAARARQRAYKRAS